MDDSSLLFWGLFFSSIGLGFFLYGRKQKSIVPLMTGIALLVFPFFVTDIYMLIITGTVLVALAYFVRI
jgi:predicted membrane protein